MAVAPAPNELLDRIVMIAAALPEVAIVPDVFADADAEPASADVEHLGAVERLEVAVLVEDVVGRAAAPCGNAARRRRSRSSAALLNSGRPSSDGFGSGRPTSVGGPSASVAREPSRRSQLRATKSPDQQQIARQISDQRQLRGDREIGAQPSSLTRSVRDQASIAVEVANRRIDLQECNLHLAVKCSLPRPSILPGTA